MSVWVVAGAQFGSEGKGKVAAFLTQSEQIDICVRCGGPNSGHCFVDNSGELRALRQIPTGYVRPESRLLIPAGGIVDLDVLKRELDLLDLGSDRVGIDFRAMIIEEQDRRAEQALSLKERLSSTLCGVGSAVSRKVLRGEDVVLAREAARDNPWLKPYLTDATAEINEGINREKKILIEGTQGLGLSLYHSEWYPKTTSRDTSAAGAISECGISPLAVTNIVLVMRTFPIRVAGAQAGPLSDEIDWETLQVESGYPHQISEYTTVTGNLRRVGRFNWADAKRAIAINRPTHLALNFVDYLDFDNSKALGWSDLAPATQKFVRDLADQSSANTLLLGTGPAIRDTIVVSSDVASGYSRSINR